MSKFWGWDPKNDELETADFTPMLAIYKSFKIFFIEDDKVDLDDRSVNKLTVQSQIGTK